MDFLFFWHSRKGNKLKLFEILHINEGDTLKQIKTEFVMAF